MQAIQLLKQLVTGFDMVGIGQAAFDRTYGLALRFVKVTDAFGTACRIDFVDQLALVNGLVRTDWLADIAVDTKLGDAQGHAGIIPFAWAD